MTKRTGCKKMYKCGNKKCWEYNKDFKCHCFKKTFLSAQKCVDYVKGEVYYSESI